MENWPPKCGADKVIYRLMQHHTICLQRKVSHSCMFTICLESISGEDSIFCEGACDSWVHRRCAGQPKIVIESIKLSDKPFLCPFCRKSDYFKVWNQLLHQKISSLEKKSLALLTALSRSLVILSLWMLLYLFPHWLINNIQDVVATFLNEAEKTLINIIIHNTPESTSREGLTIKNHDIQ